MSKLTLNENLKFDIGLGGDNLSFWAWYHKHEEDVILHVGWKFIKFSVKVNDLKPLFEKIFGPNPF